ncbi:PREDICTED: uncharacterized protein LOC108614548 [Drosophila arizonae]|uniref:Uncharacterized protein LOC108614548 n=1 Tax=Drosophila arizonae TaxID=7263 RepID=A0ABM1PAH0_DROAR|nr:PREDICTED: uncharacterized protein LOC108614548 [Drosophila arizonae]
MRLLLLLGLLGLLALALARPKQMLLIDSAPSVVSYQGSSQTHTRFVIAPMGRALGYVEPTNVNRTFHTNSSSTSLSAGHEALQIRPVYVP